MDEVREQLPAKTTPTWEMELLVSGATIVGLLQLPGLLDHGFYRARNISPQDYAQLLWPMWLYAKIAVTTLILTFLAHLTMRAYWVALVGLNSVYPGGIRWERLGLGPVARTRLAKLDHGIDAAIERADNRATRVFGVGASLAMLMSGFVLVALVALAIGLAVDVFFGEGHTSTVFGIVIAVVLGPWFLISVLDRRFGNAIARWPKLQGALAAVAGVYGRLGLGPRSNTLLALFASQVGRTRFALTVLCVFLPVAIVIMAQDSLARGQLPFGLYVGLSGNDPFSNTASPTAFYEDERGDPWSMMPMPHIRQRVVEGPYLELFVPFIPRLHGSVLPAACPGLQGGAVDNRVRLDCLARMISLQVDGVPVTVPLEATADQETGQPGMLAMIPVSALAPGRHELSLYEPEHMASGATPRRYRIPFWK